MFFNLYKVGVVVAMVAVSGSAFAKGLNLTPRAVSGVININTASAKELELLPGVGPKTASIIVIYREKNPFKSPGEIVNVKGIGNSTYSKIKGFLTISGPTTLTAVAHPNSTSGTTVKPAESQVTKPK